MTKVFIGLGSNINDPETQLVMAIKSLHQLPDTEFLCQSSFYRSKPVGPQDQPYFINAVVKLDTKMTALKLLQSLQSIEMRHGRLRKGAQHWGPRPLDLDILLFGQEQINLDNLVVPHPEMHKRNFVLIPLNEIESDLEIPGAGKVCHLLKNIGTKDIEKLEIT